MEIKENNGNIDKQNHGDLETMRKCKNNETQRKTM